ncbi:MAG: hypothetical protein ACREQ5_10825 [Candidatus Dormibacteria bacterium]
MTPELQNLFSMYVGLGAKRTIPALFAECQKLGLQVTKRMLLRYSTKYQWSVLAKQTNEALVAEVVAATKPALLDMTKKQLAALHAIQDRFIQRLALDPTDARLTPAERARAIDPDLRDFIEAVKSERLILGDPGERHEEGGPPRSRLIMDLSDDEIRAAGMALMANRYGLPKLVTTIEHDDVK